MTHCPLTEPGRLPPRCTICAAQAKAEAEAVKATHEAWIAGKPPPTDAANAPPPKPYAETWRPVNEKELSRQIASAVDVAASSSGYELHPLEQIARLLATGQSVPCTIDRATGLKSFTSISPQASQAWAKEHTEVLQLGLRGALEAARWMSDAPAAVSSHLSFMARSLSRGD